MKVSIVIATCGSEKWADLAWSRAYPSASALRTFGNCRPLEIVREHCQQMTVSQARNAAAEQAITLNPDGWLCFLDADDELEPGYVDAMAAVWVEGAITADWSPLLVPAVRFVSDRDDDSVAGIPNRGGWPTVNECVVGTLVRADRFHAVGGFRDCTDDGTELVSLEDYDLWLRCHDAGAQLVYVEDAVYRAHVNPAGRNRDQSPYAAIWTDHLARIAA